MTISCHVSFSLRCCNADVNYTTRALDILFKLFTSWCLCIVPALFLQDMYRAIVVPRSHTLPKTPLLAHAA